MSTSGRTLGAFALEHPIITILVGLSVVGNVVDALRCAVKSQAQIAQEDLDSANALAAGLSKLGLPLPGAAAAVPATTPQGAP